MKKIEVSFLQKSATGTLSITIKCADDTRPNYFSIEGKAMVAVTGVDGNVYTYAIDNVFGIEERKVDEGAQR